MVTSRAIKPRTPRRVRAADRPPEEPGLPADEAVSVNAPVVGIGCSAGGLEALTSLLGAVPADTRLSFIVVQHQDPRHPSTLPALLSRICPLQVLEAATGQMLEPGHVYVAPPHRDLSIDGASIRLAEIEPGSSLRLPVDALFRSLADGRGSQAIGVVLSGMGSDGTRGLLAIKERGGLTLAQDPASAGAASMPRSAIEAGAVDIVAPASELAARVATFLSHPHATAEGAAAGAERAGVELDQVIALLRDRTGNDFAPYKTSSLLRRIERRIALHQLGDMASYVSHLCAHPQEIDLLFKELLIGVTSFFRDPDVWAFLQRSVLPDLLARHAPGRPLRAWVAGCSSGEEAYTLAICYREALLARPASARPPLQIYATDLDADAIAKARRGFYPASIAADVGAERLERFFVPDEGGYRVAKEIRDLVIFAPQNVVSDPPFTKLDLLTCRNLLIYLGAPAQKSLLPMFHYALNADGCLVLGTAETVGTFSNLFAAQDPKVRIYRRLGVAPSLSGVPLPSYRMAGATIPDALPRPDTVDGLEQLTDRVIQQQFAPPAVLVNAEGDILYISGRTGRYLEPAAGKVKACAKRCRARSATRCTRASRWC